MTSMTTPRCTVVNVREAARGTYLYVGREVITPKWQFEEHKMYANPFFIGMEWSEASRHLNAAFWLHDRTTFTPPDTTSRLERSDAVHCFELWMRAMPDIIEHARRELAGKTLGCWCVEGMARPFACHAQVLAAFVNREPGYEL